MKESDYVNSGILQDYCFGLLSEEQAKKVEEWCLLHPDVAREVQLLRLALEKYAGSNNMWRSAELRRAVWDALKNSGTGA